VLTWHHRMYELRCCDPVNQVYLKMPCLARSGGINVHMFVSNFHIT
jgi:hypothetical protein